RFERSSLHAERSPETWYNGTRSSRKDRSRMSDSSLATAPRKVPTDSKAERERLAFRRLLPQLLSQPEYLGKYVAIHDEKVVDSDESDMELVQRVHARVGYVPIHVARVIETAAPERVPHYREHRGTAVE